MDSRHVPLVAVLVLFGTVCAADFGPCPITQFDFDEPGCLDAWSGSDGRVVTGYKGTTSLLVENGDPARSVARRIAIPAGALSGRRITVSAVVKADGVSDPPNPWNGIKVMLVLETGDGGTDDYLVDHSASIILFDPQGRFRALFGVPHDPDLIANDFILIKNYYEANS